MYAKLFERRGVQSAYDGGGGGGGQSAYDGEGRAYGGVGVAIGKLIRHSHARILYY